MYNVFMNIIPLTYIKPAKRPYLISSFVSTIDGKIMVLDKGYWPIGTKHDFEYFTNLRANSDAIIDAKNTALIFGKNTIKTINDNEFKNDRKKLGKNKNVEYIVLSTNPNEELFSKLENNFSYNTTILTTKRMATDKIKFCNFIECKSDNGTVDISDLISYLSEQGHELVYVDGGPTLISILLKNQLLDEIHLTIAPKIFGTKTQKTLTLAEGMLFPPNEIPKFKLKDVTQLKDEVILRYIFDKSG